MGILVARSCSDQRRERMADHVYVQCENEPNGHAQCENETQAWGCWGIPSGGTELLRARGSCRQAAAIAGDGGHGGVACYLVTGISHQAANRILYPARRLVEGVRGYGISEAFYGPYGRPRGYPAFSRAPFLRHDHIGGRPGVSPETEIINGPGPGGNPGTMHYIEQVIDLLSGSMGRNLLTWDTPDPVALSEAIAEFQLAMFRLMVEHRLGQDLPAEIQLTALLEARRGAEKKRFDLEWALEQSEIGIEMFARNLNEIFVDFQIRSANILGDARYARLFGQTAGDTVWLGDPDIAKAAYVPRPQAI